MTTSRRSKLICLFSLLFLIPIQAMGTRKNTQPVIARSTAVDAEEELKVVDLTHLTPSRVYHSFTAPETESMDWLSYLAQPFSWCARSIAATGASLHGCFRRNRIPILVVVSAASKFYSLSMILESMSDDEVIPLLQEHSGVHRFSETSLSFSHRHLAIIESILRLIEQVRSERHSSLLSRQIAEMIIRFHQLYGYSRIIQLPLPEALVPQASRLLLNSVGTSVAISLEATFDFLLQGELALQPEN